MKFDSLAEGALELIETDATSLNWERIVRGVLARIRSFWAQLGRQKGKAGGSFNTYGSEGPGRN